MSAQRRAGDDRTEQVWERLRAVTDPELDESVTELGFVTAVEVGADDSVHIRFRLPTYWCAVNFAFLMADDMRDAVASIPWVKSVSVMLGEHMAAEAINQGVCGGKTFEETFGAKTSQGLESIRRTFALKAFQRRQEALMRFLLADGHSPASLLAMSVGALSALSVDAKGRDLIARYLLRRPVAGSAAPAFLAFVDSNGAPLGEDGLSAYLARLRLVRVNMEANGALCRGLLAARFDEGERDLAGARREALPDQSVGEGRRM